MLKHTDTKIQGRIKKKIKKKKTHKTHLPGSVKLIDVVDHLIGQWFEVGSGQAHRQAGSQ